MAEKERPRANELLKAALEKAENDYETNLDNLIDAATQAIEDAYDPETGSWRSGQDPRDIIREFTRDAGELANSYYDVQRGLWEQCAGLDLPEFDHAEPVEPDRVLWQQMKGFSDTDFNGLTYKQVVAGQSRAGLTIENLWPDLSNLDDVQQLISDMIMTSTRLTTQRNLRIDPSEPRWARFCHGAKPCAFCVMLASRGYEYLSKETAQLGGGFHDGHCHCTVGVSWGADKTLLDKQREWEDMYDAAVGKAGGDRDTNAIMVAMNHLYPDRLRGGVYELSRPWPDEVVHLYGEKWEHIIRGHAARYAKDAPDEDRGNTRFPDDWDDEYIKWAVKETVVNPDYVKLQGTERKSYYRIIDDDVMIRVWLQITKETNGRFKIHTAYPVTPQQRERIWQSIKQSQKPTEH